MKINKRVEDILLTLSALFVIFVLPSIILNIEPLAVLFFGGIAFLIIGSVVLNGLQLTNFIGKNIIKRYKNLYEVGGRKRVIIEFAIWSLISLGSAILFQYIRANDLYWYIPSVALISGFAIAYLQNTWKEYKTKGKKAAITHILVPVGGTFGFILFFKFFTINPLIIAILFGIYILIMIIQAIRGILKSK